VTRGQVDNENNSQSQDLNISYHIHEQSLIYRVSEQSISQGYQKSRKKHSKAKYTWLRDTGMQRWTGTRSETYTNREQGWDLITSEFEWGMEVPGILEVVWK